ncbi:MAG TPA: hypothetical protein PKA59_05020 [Chakrabartia sp.]|jgi:hypothetical protein|nr:hypothetical protein [Chakrabartia sp.]
MIRTFISRAAMGVILAGAMTPIWAAAEPARPVAGGWGAGQVSDPMVKAAAEFAAAQLPGKPNVKAIEGVSQQVVAGMNYRIDLALSDGSRWQVVVYRRFSGEMQLTQSLKLSPVAETRMTLNGQGLVLTAPGGGITRVKFGTPRPQVMAALSSRPEAGESTNSECGAGPIDFASWPDGLNLLFQGGTFQGWSLDERADSLRLSNGARIGTTVAQLRKLGKFRIEKSTLGHEFLLAGVSGLVSSPRPTGKVTALWSGLDCNFR